MNVIKPCFVQIGRGHTRELNRDLTLLNHDLAKSVCDLQNSCLETPMKIDAVAAKFKDTKSRSKSSSKVRFISRFI